MGWLVLPQPWAVDLPLIGAAHSWRLYVVLCGLPSFLTALGFCFLPESPKYLLGQGRTEEALQVLRRVFHVNSGRPADEYPVSHFARARPRARPSPLRPGAQCR